MLLRQTRRCNQANLMGKGGGLNRDWENPLYKEKLTGIDHDTIKKWVGEIPVPNNMKDSIRTQFENQPEYKPVLECAACLGMEFQASVLAESLNTGRMELLRILKEIEARTGMIKDVREADDLFKFQSSLILEVVREQMSISGKKNVFF